MAILPDDIRDIETSDGPLQTIHRYIRYMREQIEFWGSNREREIKSMEVEADSISEVFAAFLSKFVDGDGYIQFPNGTLVNYGVTNVTASSSAYEDVTFPKSFADATYIIYAVPMYQYPSDLSVVGLRKSKTQFRLWHKSLTGSEITDTPVAWLAIGKK